MDISELKPILDSWIVLELSPMVDHIKKTIDGGCSIERWIVLSLGKFLCNQRKCTTNQIEYERKYDSIPKIKCDLWVDGLWIEIKHIWDDTQKKTSISLDTDVERVKNVRNGMLLARIIHNLLTRFRNALILLDFVVFLLSMGINETASQSGL